MTETITDTTDPLGPMTFTDAQALRVTDLPDLPGPFRFQFMTWEAQASTPQAKALQADIALTSGIGLGEQPGQPRKRGPKPKMSEAEVLEAFVGDLLRNAKTRHWSGQPMTTAAFAGLPLGATTFRRVLGAMAKSGLVQVAPGYKKRDDLGDSAITKFRPTEALLRRAEAHGIPWRRAKQHFGRPDDATRKARDPVVIVSLEDRAKLLPLPQTDEARQRVAEVEAFNGFVGGLQIQSGSPDAPVGHHPVFQRRFHGDLRFHGRLYDRGNSYQGLASPDDAEADWEDSRASLTINGEPVVELDVHASGLTILHGLAGVPLPARSDLYSLSGLPRDAVKTWITSFVGKGGEPLRNWPQDAPPAVRKVSRKAVREAVLEAYPLLLDLPALLGVEEAPRLAGKALEALEAEAVLGAVFALQAEGILALPIHDSVVVQERQAERARTVLEDRYRAIAGVIPVVRTKTGTTPH